MSSFLFVKCSSPTFLQSVQLNIHSSLFFFLEYDWWVGSHPSKDSSSTAGETYDDSEVVDEEPELGRNLNRFPGFETLSRFFFSTGDDGISGSNLIALEGDVHTILQATVNNLNNTYSEEFKSLYTQIVSSGDASGGPGVVA